jgi:hypothetical protein
MIDAMAPLQRLKILIWDFCHVLSPALEHHLKSRFSRSYWANWGERTRQVQACPDNAFISRVPNAGEISGDVQVMHNGLKILVGSYYGKEAAELLRKNKGVHEPQEERVFQEVLKHVPPNSAMIELGAYWAFYSMWFCQAVKGGRAYLVEPVAENLACGKRNFELNSFQGCFTQALVGAASNQAPDGSRTICVDDLVSQHQLTNVAILHSDIQGFELDMLKGAEKTITEGKVSFFFISTHSEELHRSCEEFLRHKGCATMVSITPAESFSMDGILVCRAADAPIVPAMSLSRKGAHQE